MTEKMVDMGITKAELKAEKKEMAVGYDGQPNPYPWGLNIRLEGREMEKLGMKDMPKVGTELQFMCVARVTSCNMSAREGQDSESRSIGMQITQMQIMAPEGGQDKE